MTTDEQSSKWGFNRTWMVANMVCWGLLLILPEIAGYLIHSWRPSNRTASLLLLWVIVGVLWGVALGLLQMFLLKSRLDLKGKEWFWATMVGAVLYVVFLPLEALLLSSASASHRDAIRLAISFIHSLAFGRPQWYDLRRRFERAGLWIVAVELALWLAGVVSQVLKIVPEGSGISTNAAIASPMLSTN